VLVREDAVSDEEAGVSDDDALVCASETATQVLWNQKVSEDEQDSHHWQRRCGHCYKFGGKGKFMPDESAFCKIWWKSENFDQNAAEREIFRNTKFGQIYR
jgi:hypothetical protein